MLGDGRGMNHSCSCMFSFGWLLGGAGGFARALVVGRVLALLVGAGSALARAWAETWVAFRTGVGVPGVPGFRVGGSGGAGPPRRKFWVSALFSWVPDRRGGGQRTGGERRGGPAAAAGRLTMGRLLGSLALFLVVVVGSAAFNLMLKETEGATNRLLLVVRIQPAGRVIHAY